MINKRIAILGSTGSIGRNALDVIAHLGSPYRATAISGHRQITKLVEQVKTHRPAAVGIAEADALPALRDALSGSGAELYAGQERLAEMACRDDVDIVLTAIVGAAGLVPTIAACRSGKTLALANKESLVVAGSILMPEAKTHGVNILPVDSEHSAVFQAMKSGRLSEVRRVILTASGGPFRNSTADAIENATVEDALKHPTWSMGSKITIDSASMFNKALELIEACWLFDMPPEKVEIVVHPESVIHSMVEFVDGSTIAQLSPPDMKTPIQYALTYPDRLDGCSPVLDITRKFSLNFEPPDLKRFPALRLGYEVATLKQTYGAVLNAAKESAVDAFCEGEIRFGMIWRVVENTMQQHQPVKTPVLEDLLEADRWAREAAVRYIQKKTH